MKVDLTDKKIGRLTVIKLAEQRSGKNYWLCLCECGKETTVRASCLINELTKSCGCLASDLTIKRETKHGFSKPGNLHPLYAIWREIRARCNDPKRAAYPNYGGRGIKLCEKWNDFQNFYDDMFPTWTKGLTVERIDVNKGYSPENCRWATRTEQARNKRNNKNFTINGQTKCLTEWCEIFQIEYSPVQHRLNDGWDIETALKTPVKEYKPRVQNATCPDGARFRKKK